MRYITGAIVSLFAASDLFAMAGAPGTGKEGGGGIVSMLLPMVIVFAIFYLLLIRPQQKQQKKTKAMLESMQKGDMVITRGGIHGKIHGIADNIVTLEIADNVKIKINKEFIGVVQGKENILKK